MYLDSERYISKVAANMVLKLRVWAFLFVFVVSSGCAHAHSLCDGVIKKISDSTKGAMSRKISKSLSVNGVNIIEYFELSEWRIAYVDDGGGDEVFLFYSGSPMDKNYINEWSGAAKLNEEEKIFDWSIATMPKIPVGLAKCFAWYVTHGRNSLGAQKAR